MLCRSCSRLCGSNTLSRLLESVASGRVSLSAADVYRLCAVTKEGGDVLGLLTHGQLMRTLAGTYAKLAADTEKPLSPFQDALMKTTLTPFLDGASGVQGANVTSTAGGRESRLTDTGARVPDGVSVSSRSAGTRGSATSDARALDLPTPSERLKAIWELLEEAFQGERLASAAAAEATRRASTSAAAGETDNGIQAVHEESDDAERAAAVTTSTVKMVETHVTAMEGELRQLTPGEVCSLVKALASIHYQHFQHTSLLSRRGCEIAAELPLSEACKLFFNLHKLNTHDSLHAITNRILSGAQQLSLQDVFLTAQSLERQTNTSPASAQLVPALCTQGVRQLAQSTSPTYHRALLSALARYSSRQTLAAGTAVFTDLARLASRVHERDLLVVLRAAADLRIPLSAPAQAGSCTALLQRAEEILPGMDIRNVDALMDVLSFLPVDTSGTMNAIMQRLDADAGKLSILQVEFVLQLLSGYPPARGNVCLVSLAFAVALRAESVDPKTLESIVVSLAMLGHFNDDFVTLAKVFLQEKGGFRKFHSFFTFLESCPASLLTDRTAASQRDALEALIRAGYTGLLPTLSDAEVAQCRSQFRRLHMQDTTAQPRASRQSRGASRTPGWGSSQQLAGQRRGSKPRRKHYDPMSDLLE